MMGCPAPLPGQEFEPTRLEVTEGQTSAPTVLSESELIALMDANGIGTDATIAEHIATVLKRTYAMKGVLCCLGTCVSYGSSLFCCTLVPAHNHCRVIRRQESI